MKQALLLTALLLSQPAFAGVIGKWKTIDDDTKQAKSIVEIYETANGTLEGKVIKLLQKPGALCTKCKGNKKDKPIEGMIVLWGLKKSGDSWTSGSIFDPNKGNTYGAEIQLIDGGKSLKVTGKLLMFSRSQIWHKQ